ncbi:hypothetical protein FGO68_gene9941 [Halteria grandinella]|uniref:TmcB/TmcC TPR repeats domain-containing protein n=1 Tax=Halteria grandinella TaxID=5974 RepID=A0A8J8P4H0_HALGN|nr:hypothetical protein FGO68_gene9941 [Halteria grandinella]
MSSQAKLQTRVKKTQGVSPERLMNNTGGQSSGSHSSGSSSLRERFNNAKHFTEDTRLLEAVQLYSSLEQQDQSDFKMINQIDSSKHISGLPQQEGVQTKMGSDMKTTKIRPQNGLGLQHSESGGGMIPNYFSQIQMIMVRKLFQVNNVILDYQAITPLIYHIILLLEFIQILFFMFYKVDIVNEFTSQTFFDTSPQSGSTSTNGTSSNDDLTTDDLLDTFQIDSYFQFINFQLYPLEHQSEQGFLTFFILINATFYGFLMLLFTLSDRLFQAQRQEDIKEGMRLTLKLLSILMVSFLFLFQLPMLTTYFQCFLCDEDPEDVYILATSCDSLTRHLLIAVATFSLVVYFGFLVVQQLLYSSNNFQTNVPWGSLERNITLFKVLYKLVIAVSFTMNKTGTQGGEVHLICFFIAGFLLYKRCTSAFFLDPLIQFAAIQYETMLTWLFLVLAAHIFSGAMMTLFNLSLIFSFGLLAGFIINIFQYHLHLKVIATPQPNKTFQTPALLMAYLFRLYSAIQNFTPQDKLMLQGILSCHKDECIDGHSFQDKCQCQMISDKLYGLKKYKILKQSADEELLKQGTIRVNGTLKGSNAKNVAFEAKELHAMDSDKSSSYNRTFNDAHPKIKDNHYIGSSADLSKRDWGKQNHIEGKSQLITHKYRENILLGAKKDTGLISNDVDRGEVGNSAVKQMQIVQQLSKTGSSPMQERRHSGMDDGFINAKFKHQKQSTGSLYAPQNSMGINKVANSPASPPTILKASKFKEAGKSVASLKNESQNDYGSGWIYENAQRELAEYLENEDAELSRFNQQQLDDKQQKLWFLFFSLLVQEAISLHPKNIDFRILSSFIQRTKLHNEFKAIFEIMNCESCSPSLQDKFVIYRRKVVIEQSLLQKHERSIQDIGNLNIVSVYRYEKFFLRYQLLEYVTANSALKFWRELLQKSIDANALQLRGAEISKNYERIQDVAAEIMKIYPNEIKFMFRYAHFLQKIVNNDYDGLALLEKVFSTYQTKLSKKAAAMPINEQTIYGENTASSIVIISATSTEVGTVLHANDEIEFMLGHKRKNIIGKNVSIIMPRVIAENHSNFIQNYFTTAKSRFIDKQTQVFAQCANGYLKGIRLLVKVYPNLNDKIQFIGFIQAIEMFDQQMDPPKNQFEHLEHQYILCDQKGNIFHVTDGLNFELGLNSKFFDYNPHAVNSQINIQVVCPEIMEPDIQDMLESEGTILPLDTREMLNLVELEKLTSEEILEVRTRLGTYQAYVQLKKLAYGGDGSCMVYLYRFIIVTEDDIIMRRPTGNQASSGTPQRVGSRFGGGDDGENVPSGLPILGVDQQDHYSDDYDLSSVASAGALQSHTFNKMIRDFKKVLAERRTPGNLVLLNRTVAFIVLITVALSSVDFWLKQRFVEDFHFMSKHALKSEIRTIQLMQLQANIRSLIDVANDMEFRMYEGTNLMKINRFTYLSHLVQTQASDLQDTHDFMIQQRSKQNSKEDLDQSDFEYESIDLFRLDLSNNISTYGLPFRVALNQYLNNILMLNGTGQSDLIIPYALLRADPTIKLKDFFSSPLYQDQASENITINYTLQNGTLLIQTIPGIVSFTGSSPFQKNLYFVLANQLRGIRERTMEANQFMQKNEYKETMDSAFLAIMIVGIAVSTISIMTVLYSIWNTERNKADTLSLYAYLKMDQIKKVYDKCDEYLDSLLDNTEEVRLMNQTHDSRIGSDSGYTMAAAVSAANHQDAHPSDLSEEEKEEQNFNQYLQRQKRQRHKDGHRHTHKKSGNFLGYDRYAAMIKRAANNVRHTINLEQAHNFNYDLNGSQAQGQSGSLNENGSESAVSSDRRLMHEEYKEIHRNKKRFESSMNQDIAQSEESESYDMNEIQRGESLGQIRNALPASGLQRRGSMRRQVENKVPQNAASDHELKQEEIEQRKKLFFQSVKNRNWRFLTLNGLVGVVFSIYFVYGYIFHFQQLNQLSIIKGNTPIFFNRYSDMILSYSYMRERIMNNNEIQSYNNYTPTGTSADDYFKEKSMKNEQNVKAIKVANPSIMKDVIAFEELADSENFCTDIIGQFKGGVEEKFTVSRNAEKKLREIRRKAYQNLISTVIAACNAASAGDLETLKRLKEEGVDLNKGDYDNRTPLHVGTGAGLIHIVKFLIDSGVKLSPVDRWGATPLCDAQPYPEIKKLLLDHGAILGKIQETYTPFQVQVTDDQFRLYYAAFFGDVEMMENLRLLGWDVNGQDYDGRTALGVAASEGQLEAVKYLVSKGADLSIKDGRGNDPLGDATRQNRTATIEYLSSIINQSLIRDWCSSFYDGLVKKGIYQMFGVFQKKFSDLQISIQQPTSRRLSLLEANYTLQNNTLVLNNITNLTASSAVKKNISVDPIPYSMNTLQTMKMFITTNELYLHTVIDKFTSVFETCLEGYASQYSNTANIVYLVFLMFQLLILLYLRSKLIQIIKEDVFQSRGILNLIPEDFFNKNREQVEKLIKKLKD